MKHIYIPWLLFGLLGAIFLGYAFTHQQPVGEQGRLGGLYTFTSMATSTASVASTTAVAVLGSSSNRAFAVISNHTNSNVFCALTESAGISTATAPIKLSQYATYEINSANAYLGSVFCIADTTTSVIKVNYNN